MDLSTVGLREQPFRTSGQPIAIVEYASYADALAVLRKTCASPTGLSLLQGPPLSGKTTLIHQFATALPKECSVAVVDGTGMDTKKLLETLLRKFGYVVDISSTGELLAMMRVFCLQQASSNEPPVVIIENSHGLKPSALRAMCELAALQVRQTSAIKLVLASDRSLRPIVEAPSMQNIATRLIADYHLHPMSAAEARDYLHAKLAAAGSDAPDCVFPAAVCNELWQASGGWPGILDRVALFALARSDSLPVTTAVIERPEVPDGTWDEERVGTASGTGDRPVEPPTLYVTQNGKTLETITFDQPRLLIGRSEHNDLAIDSRFVSRHHLLLVRHGNATFLMDLNSTNGTFVNSKRVSNHVLINDDVISLGHHRIKFYDPHAKRRADLDQKEFADTAIMKTLDDMRALLAEENTQEMPAPSENIPTLGN